MKDREREKLLLIFESRTGRITKTVTRALILLLEKSRQFRRISARNTQLFANAFVPQLGQRFRTLNTQTVKVEIVGVIV